MPAEFLSDALYAATVCEEGPLGWARTTAPGGPRIAEAEAALRNMPAAALSPFDRTTALFASPIVQLCNRWPLAAAEPALQDGPFPQCRRSSSPARTTCARRSIRAAHRVANRRARRSCRCPRSDTRCSDGFPRTCGLRAVDDFFAGRALRRCAPRRREFPPVPLAPRSLAALDPQPGVSGRAGRTVSAVALTLIDSLDQVFSAALMASPDQDVLHVGGLRAGYARAGLRTLELHGLEYVPGVRVTGTLRMTREPHGVLRVTGRSAARGQLRFRKDGSVRGRLGGRRVRIGSGAAAARRIESRAWQASEALSRWASRSTRRWRASSAPMSSATTPRM